MTAFPQAGLTPGEEPNPPAAAVAFGPFRFDPAEGVLRRNGIEVPMPPRALAVLALLVAHAGRLVPKQLLLQTVWSDAFVTETSLAEAVSIVRQALGDNPQSPTYIQTVHRRGYRFIAAAHASHAADWPRVTATPSEPPGTLEAPAVAPPPDRGRWGRWRRWTGRRPGLALGMAATALAVVVAGVWELARQPAALHATGVQAVRRLLIDLPAGASLDTFMAPAVALSPSGEELVFVAREGGRQRLYRRALDQFEASPIAGTDGAAAPFFSPDGRWIGFFAQGKLEKVALAGGEPLALCDSPYPYGASWSEDGSILFAPDFRSGLQRVAAAGGVPTVLTTPDRRHGEVGHRWPEVVPGGRAALLTVWRQAGWASASVELLDLRSGRRTELIRGGSDAHYSPSGHLVFARGGGAQGLAALIRHQPLGAAPRRRRAPAAPAQLLRPAACPLFARRSLAGLRLGRVGQRGSLHAQLPRAGRQAAAFGRRRLVAGLVSRREADLLSPRHGPHGGWAALPRGRRRGGRGACEGARRAGARPLRPQPGRAWFLVLPARLRAARPCSRGAGFRRRALPAGAASADRTLTKLPTDR